MVHDQGVGREIKKLREARGWSQAKLAVEAEMSVSGVSMIENGQRNLTTTTLAKLADAFGLEIPDLFPKAQARLPLEAVGRGEATEPEEDGRYTGLEAYGQVLASAWEVELAGWNEKIAASSHIGGAAELRFLQWVVDVFVTVGIFRDVAHHHGPPRQELADTLQMMKDVREAAWRKAQKLRECSKTDKQFRELWEANNMDAVLSEAESHDTAPTGPSRRVRFSGGPPWWEQEVDPTGDLAPTSEVESR